MVWLVIAINSILTTGGILVFFSIFCISKAFTFPIHTVEVNVGQWRLHHTSHSCLHLSHQKLPGIGLRLFIAVITSSILLYRFAWRVAMVYNRLRVLNLLPLILNRNRSAGKLLSILRRNGMTPDKIWIKT